MKKAVIEAMDNKTPYATRTASGGYETKEGTLYVSQPFRSSSNKKLRAVIAFAPRKSAFETDASKDNEFKVRTW